MVTLADVCSRKKDVKDAMSAANEMSATGDKPPSQDRPRIIRILKL